MTDHLTSITTVFDGHNDALLERYYARQRGTHSFLTRNQEGHLDLPRAVEGGFAGGLFAICVPNDPDRKGPNPADLLKYDSGYEMKLADPVDQPFAESFTLEIIADLEELILTSRGSILLAESVRDINDAMHRGALAVMLHLEGAEAVTPDLGNLGTLYRSGIRSIGIVWSRPNAFGHGVPFKYPSSPDTGPGLTADGKRLVSACNEIGILVDVAHLNERGFYDVAEVTSKPVVCSHAGAHALCPTARNLTDKQLHVIRESNGLVGVTFFGGDLSNDGTVDCKSSLDDIIKHIRYIVDKIGIDHVALGSDFDGATISDEMGDVTGLPRLFDRLRECGFDESALKKIACENWLRILEATLIG